MKGNNYHYTKQDIISALKEVGLKPSDSIFIHSNIGFFGKLENASTPEDYYYTFKESIFSLIGNHGTLIVPTFSYSFCNNHEFDPENTPSVCGFFSENLRKDKEAFRSFDANFSIAAIGEKAKFFTESPTSHSFGINSFWDRLLQYNGKIVNFNFDAASTYIHFVEKQLNVPYRYDKPFPGTLILNNQKSEHVFYHFVFDHEKPQDGPDFAEFDRKAKEYGFASISNLGKGQIVSISVKDTTELIEKEFKTNPRFLTVGKNIIK